MNLRKLGNPISNEELFNSILKYNKFRKEISEIGDLNITGSKKLEIYQKAMLYGPKILEEIDSLKNVQSNENSDKNILFTGCSIFMGDDLIKIIEDGGGNIIFFDTWVGDIYFSQYFDKEWLIGQNKRNQIDILVESFKKNNLTDHCIPNFVEYKVKKIIKIIESLRSNFGLNNIGIINHIIKFCDHMSLPKEQIKEKLQLKNYFVLNLERDYSRASHGQLSTRIEAFLEMM
jgi:benzoyl-CoA reductase/2-hydroxyglutaryl-CoA dehydratase subunit BcrC/BadD/HgdB